MKEVTTLEEKISLLVRLQVCDNRIREILRQKAEGPRRIGKLKEELDATDSKFQAENDRLEQLKTDRRHIEQEIQELDSNMEKSSIKLANIKSNKEYKAALKELEELKQNKALSEDRAIQVMEEIEQLERGSSENKAKQAELREKFDRDRTVIEKEIEALDKDLAGLETKRTELHRTIDPDLLKRYLFLSERKQGQAIISVIGGVCQACYMGLPPQKFNELIKGHALMSCPNCNRMIYWGENEQFQRARENA
jgi:predicted  nucleic acid-binding Zn-ribbon protein